jgi:hypothetical protein
MATESSDVGPIPPTSERELLGAERERIIRLAKRAARIRERVDFPPIDESKEDR